MNKEIVPNVLVAVIVGVGAYVITPFVKSTDAHAAASEMINTPPFKTSLVQGVVAKLAVDEGMREALLDAMKANDPDFRGLRGHPGGQGETGPGCEVGSVVAWPSNAEIPSGWMKCDGEPIDRMKYAKLFGILGVTYGGGDDVKTFNLPNFQGMFLRGEGRQVGKDGEERHVSGEFGICSQTVFRITPINFRLYIMRLQGAKAHRPFPELTFQVVRNFLPVV